MSMSPVRVQRRRTNGWRMPENTVYVGRGSEWGNPYKVQEYGRQGAVDIYRADITTVRIVVQNIRDELRGKNLACWCRLDQPCHADVLLELANQDNK